MKGVVALFSLILVLNLTVLTTVARRHPHPHGHPHPQPQPHPHHKQPITKNSNNYNIVTLGAKPNSNFDSSSALQLAWQYACGSSDRTTITIPQGRFLVQKALKFSGKGCKSSGIEFNITGTIIAPTDFNVLKNSRSWLLFDNVNGVKINGGTFDGKGKGLWACKRSGNSGCPRGVETLTFRNSNHIEINGVTSLDSQLYHIVFDGCNDVQVQGAIVSASANSPNTDGIHVEASTDVTILNSNIGTGDDCISIAAGTTNLWMQEIDCGPGHGISIGSLGKQLKEPGVYNVTLTGATFRNTENGVRIKTWARPSNGFAKKVVFQHITMIDARNPIIIDQDYCPHRRDCPGQISGVTIDDVTYNDIHGSSATQTAIKLGCSPKKPCTNIKVGDIDLNYKQTLPLSTCRNSFVSKTGYIRSKGCLTS